MKPLIFSSLITLFLLPVALKKIEPQRYLLFPFGCYFFGCPVTA